MSVRFSNSETRSSEDLISAATKNLDPKTYSVSDTKVAGINAKKIEINQTTTAECTSEACKSQDIDVLETAETVYLVKDSNKTLEITFEGTEWQKYQSIFDQVLSTFHM